MMLNFIQEKREKRNWGHDLYCQERLSPYLSIGAPDMIDMLNGGFVVLGERIRGSTASGRPSLVFKEASPLWFSKENLKPPRR